jgi:hypothetical protein
MRRARSGCLDLLRVGFDESTRDVRQDRRGQMLSNAGNVAARELRRSMTDRPIS